MEDDKIESMRSLEDRRWNKLADRDPRPSRRADLRDVPLGRTVAQLLSGVLFLLLMCAVTLTAQNSDQSSTDQSSSSGQSSSASRKSASTTASEPAPNRRLEPPRSDRVNINDMGNTEGESSSKTTEIDLSPPADDAKEHPRSADAMDNAENPPVRSSGDVSEMHAWNPHKAAKDIEVGDFYFKRKNYRAAESRYREALYYKDNDADATYRLAICLEKMNRPDDAIAEFQSYLRILPHGSKAEDAQKAIDRLSKPQSEKAAK